MESRIMRRARRAARTVKRGVEMLDRLREPDAIGLMKEAVENDVPAVSGISDLLWAEFGAAVRELPVRKLIGLCVRAVLDGEGYQVAQSGVRIYGDKIFSTGSTYQEVAEETAEPDSGDDDDLIELLVKVAGRLSSEGRRQVLVRLESSVE